MSWRHCCKQPRERLAHAHIERRAADKAVALEGLEGEFVAMAVNPTPARDVLFDRNVSDEDANTCKVEHVVEPTCKALRRRCIGLAHLAPGNVLLVAN